MSLPTADQTQNDVAIEQSFAVKVVQHSDAYWNLLLKILPSTPLRLTRFDTEILSSVQESFPELFEGSPEKCKLAAISEDDDLKSEDMKKRWREWLKTWEGRIDDYNFGTLLRAKANSDYSESNSIFVLRAQFLAIEIARNHLKLNDWIYLQAQKDAKKTTKA